MLGIRITIVSFLLCAALSAQTVWMPLDEGNLWIYRASGAAGAASYTVRVDRAERPRHAERRRRGPSCAAVRRVKERSA